MFVITFCLCLEWLGLSEHNLILCNHYKPLTIYIFPFPPLFLFLDMLDGVPVQDLVTLGEGRTMQSATFLAPLSVAGNLKVSAHFKVGVA